MFLNDFQKKTFQQLSYIFFINVTYIQEACINVIKYDRKGIYNVRRTSI